VLYLLRELASDVRAIRGDNTKHITVGGERETPIGGLFWTVRHQEIADRDLDRLAILIEGRGSHLDQTKVRARLRWPNFEHFTLDA
jgi:hypothetical protein